ncbi:MAG: hypothetical protein LRY36_01150 [Alphaproteobacteria bacterium]|nr:hypothetical protein [Alphaproteobacteria bacterium]
MLKVHDTLRFKFYTVITRERFHGDTERFILWKKPDGSLGTNDLSIEALRNTPADHSAALALRDSAQASNLIPATDMECTLMQVDITPLEFPAHEHERMKVLGALESLPNDLCVKRSDLLSCLPIALTREFPEPEWPRPQTQDGNRPALLTRTMLLISPADFHDIVAAHDPQKEPGAFGTALLDKTNIYCGEFNRLAQKLGKQLLHNNDSECKMVLLASLYSHSETAPVAPHITHKAVRKSVLGAMGKVENTNTSLDHLRQLIEKTP